MRKLLFLFLALALIAGVSFYLHIEESVDPSVASVNRGYLKTGIHISPTIGLTANTTVPPIGDTISTPSALFGFNKLRTAYTGDAINIERASDGTSTDIGFDANGNFDETAFDTFCNATTCYTNTWYDQSGNGYNVVQTGSDAIKPVVGQDADGYWYIYCNGTDRLETASGFLGTPPASVTGYALWQWPANGTVSGLTGGITFATTDQEGFITPGWTTEQAGYYYGGASAYAASNRIEVDQQPRLFGFKDLSDEVTLYDGPGISLVTETLDSLEYQRIRVCTNAFANGNHRIYEFGIFSSSGNWASIWAHTKNRFADMFTKNNLYVVVGDSQTSGLFPGPLNPWVIDWITANSLTDTQVFQRGAYRIQDWLDDYDDTIGATLSGYTLTGTTRCIAWLGTNDMTLDTLTGAQAYARFETLITNLKTSGCNEVYGMTALPRGGDTSIVEPELSFNALMVADTDLDGVIRLDQNSNLTDSTNTTYFNVDQVHLTAAGHDQVQAEVDAVLTP